MEKAFLHDGVQTGKKEPTTQNALWKAPDGTSGSQGKVYGKCSL